DTTGRRAALNYGHTLGHAIELAAHFRYAHGEAVAIGMACAGDIAVSLGVLDAREAARIEALIQRAGLPVRAENVSQEAVLAAMRLDKKFKEGVNRFVLCHGIGAVEIHSNIPEALVRKVLEGRLCQ
ncbi:MAG: 3-dehydroquinate synthase, partial [Chloroflexi bacterium]|nr:3-dehydroquinate synthase [Chloroflexota bacterium]